VSTFAAADIERFSAHLGEELELYRMIRTMTEEQAELLDKDDIEAFNDSLDKREELIEKIKGLHQESAPLMQSYVSMTSGGKNKNKEIEKLRKQIREELEASGKLNDDNINTMKSKTEDHTKRIDKQSAKRKGIGGYAQSVPNTPEMFDKKT